MVQKQLGDALAERDVAADQLKAAEQQAAAEIGQRVRVESQVVDSQQQLSRQTAEASKALEACKRLNEKVGLCLCVLCCGNMSGVHNLHEISILYQARCTGRTFIMWIGIVLWHCKVTSSS